MVCKEFCNVALGGENILGSFSVSGSRWQLARWEFTGQSKYSQQYFGHLCLSLNHNTVWSNIEVMCLSAEKWAQAFFHLSCFELTQFSTYFGIILHFICLFHGLAFCCWLKKLNSSALLSFFLFFVLLLISEIQNLRKNSYVHFYTNRGTD